MNHKINSIFKNWTRPDRPLIFVKTMTRPDPTRSNQTRGTTRRMRSYGMIFVSPGEDYLECLSGDGLSPRVLPRRRFFLPRLRCVSIRFIRAQYVFGLCEWQLGDCFCCLAWCIKSSSFRAYILNVNVNKKAKTSGETAFQRPICLYIYIYIYIAKFRK